LCIMRVNELSHNVHTLVHLDLVTEDNEHDMLLALKDFGIINSNVWYVLRIKNFFNIMIACVDLNFVNPVIPLGVNL
jgi:hypothetical protein